FLGVSLSWLGRQTRAIEMLERAQELGVRGGGTRIAPEAASWVPAVMAYGPVPAPDADERWRELRVSSSMSRYARAFGDVLNAIVLAMMGRFDDARTQWSQAEGVLAELGDELHAAATSMQRGYVELLAGELEAAAGFLELVAPTEALDTRGRTWASFGYVLASAGSSDDALGAYSKALKCFEAKGNLPSAARVRRTIERLGGKDMASEPASPGTWGTTWPRGR